MDENLGDGWKHAWKHAYEGEWALERVRPVALSVVQEGGYSCLEQADECSIRGIIIVPRQEISAVPWYCSILYTEIQRIYLYSALQPFPQDDNNNPPSSIDTSTHSRRISLISLIIPSHPVSVRPNSHSALPNCHLPAQPHPPRYGTVLWYARSAHLPMYFCTVRAMIPMYHYTYHVQ